MTRSGWDDGRDILPDVTVDEAGPGWGDDPRGPADDDARLRDERPPHWDNAD